MSFLSSSRAASDLTLLDGMTVVLRVWSQRLGQRWAQCGRPPECIPTSFHLATFNWMCAYKMQWYRPAQVCHVFSFNILAVSEPRGCIWYKKQVTLIRPTRWSGAWHTKGSWSLKHWPAPGWWGRNREQGSNDPPDSEAKAHKEEAILSWNHSRAPGAKEENGAVLSFLQLTCFQNDLQLSIEAHIGLEAHRTAESRKGYSLQSSVLLDPFAGQASHLYASAPSFPLAHLFFLSFRDEVSCIPAGWSQTHHVAEDNLGLLIPLPPLLVLELQAWLLCLVWIFVVCLNLTVLKCHVWI